MEGSDILSGKNQLSGEAFKANVHMPPMGHYGDVEKEIGRVCVQLASPDFKYPINESDPFCLLPDEDPMIPGPSGCL